MKRVTRQDENENGTCPFQLIERLQALAEKLGRTPRSFEIPFEESLKRVFGTYENAMRRAGLQVRGVGQNVLHWTKYTPQTLTHAMQDFKRIHGRKPARSDARRRLVPAVHMYEKFFGSWRKALKHAFSTDT